MTEINATILGARYTYPMHDDPVNEQKAKRHAAAALPVSRIGDTLVELGVVDRAAIEQAADAAQIANRRLGELLIEGMYIDDADLYLGLARQFQRRFVRLDDYLPRLDAALATRYSRQYLRSHFMLPIAYEKNRLTVVTCLPSLELEKNFGPLPATEIEYWITTPLDFGRAWNHLNLGDLRLPEEMLSRQRTQAEHEVFEEADSETVRLFEAILEDAFSTRATDIHFETYGERVRLRYRIDGDLQTILKYPLTWRELAGFANLAKIAARLDLAERRRPQGGAIHRVIGGHVVDIRLQTQPTLYGENIILRLLPQTTRRLGIDDLGFHPAIANRYRRLLDSPSGLVLVVGPTGSGKTTTIYAALQQFARDETRKVITIEDPVEYVLAGLQQTQIMPVLGYDFANAMRVIVRQDPDVIMLGEVRDHETALETIRASQTGHLVLSTLHCNDALDAVQRLIDLGMHPNSIASELLLVIAQRLAPRICASCKVDATADPQLVGEIFPAGLPKEFRCFSGKGCDRCGGKGVYGRVAVYEFLEMHHRLRQSIVEQRYGDPLRKLALASGFVPLRDVGLMMVQQGIIPLEAMRQILLPERMAPDDPAVPFRIDPFVIAT